MEEKNSRGKGVRQGYIWAAVAVRQKLILYLYENGSRSGKVLFDLLSEYEGTVQSDAYSPYRKLESDAYPGIKRIACLQHVKRKFLEIQEEPDAQKIVELTNKLYQKEHEHCVGRQGWTDKDNLRHRKRYAPQILSEIKRELLRIKSKPDLLPKSEMAGAVDYNALAMGGQLRASLLKDITTWTIIWSSGTTDIYHCPEEIPFSLEAIRGRKEVPYFIRWPVHAECRE